MKLDLDLLKCSLVAGILFFVFSHPLLYRFMHKRLSSFVSLVDERMCPTEAGVLVHAIIFALVVYFGKVLYEKYMGKSKKNNKPTDPQQKLLNLQNQQNNIPQKCQVYCEKLSNKIQNKINNLPQVNQNQVNQFPIPNHKNPSTMMHNHNMAVNNNVGVNNNMAVNNNGGVNNNMALNNNVGVNNNMALNNNVGVNNNMALNNNVGVNNNMALNNNGGVNNNMALNNNGGVNNQALNNNMLMNENNMGNNASFDNMVVNTLSGNNQNDNGLSCNSMSDFTNQISSGNMFSENTTYVDDMYSSVNF